MIVAIVIGLVIGLVAGAAGIVALGGYLSRRTLAAAEERAERILADATAERDLVMERARAQAAEDMLARLRQILRPVTDELSTFLEESRATD